MPAILTDYLSRDQLAKELACSTRTLTRYAAQPDGLPSLMIAGRRYYRLQAVRDWLAARETHPNPLRMPRGHRKSPTRSAARSNNRGLNR